MRGLGYGGWQSRQAAPPLGSPSIVRRHSHIAREALAPCGSRVASDCARCNWLKVSNFVWSRADAEGSKASSRHCLGRDQLALGCGDQLGEDLVQPLGLLGLQLEAIAVAQVGCVSHR